jgi:serine O-acetyltransferase
MLYHGVTLGGRTVDRGKRHPTVGNGVLIGAGATVLGPITIGDRSQIGALALVTRDVPADSVATGIPATSRPLDRTARGTGTDGFLVDPAIHI